jgi:hypothetical protein
MRAGLLARDITRNGDPAVVGGLRALSVAVEGGLRRAPVDGIALHPAWDNTGVIAKALRPVLHSTNNPDVAAFILTSAVASLQRALRPSSPFGQTLDHAWIVLEHLEEAAIPLVTAPGHTGPVIVEFARLYAKLASTVSGRPVKCALAWGINELVERGSTSKALGLLVAGRLAECDDVAIRGTLGALLHLRAKELRELPESQLALIREGSAALIAPMRAAVEEFGGRVIGLERRRPSEAVDALLVALDPLVRELDRPDALSVVLGLAALKLAFKPALELLAREPKLRRPALRAICERLFLPASRDPGRLIFPRVEAAEAIRDKYPGPCARIMADLVPHVDDRVRQGLFLCLAEGYEEKFDGTIQPRIPRFRHEPGGETSFEVPRGRQLDHFGRLIAAVYPRLPELRPFMAWFNARLAHWQAA